MTSTNVFEVHPLCLKSSLTYCALADGHLGECVEMPVGTVNWCNKRHPSGVSCNLPADHTGLCVHTSEPTELVVCFHWEGPFTKEECEIWRARAVLMNVDDIYI